jgi:hypothetical protein
MKCRVVGPRAESDSFRGDQDRSEPRLSGGRVSAAFTGIGTLRVGSTLNGEQFPGPRHPFEFVLATVVELDSRAEDEVLDGPRHQHLSRVGQRSDPRSDVDRNATEVIASDLTLAGM